MTSNLRLLAVFAHPDDETLGTGGTLARYGVAGFESHRSQLPGDELLKSLSAEHHRALWGTQEYYRAFSLVGGGRAIEDDLFAGLR